MIARSKVNMYTSIYRKNLIYRLKTKFSSVICLERLRRLPKLIGKDWLVTVSTARGGRRRRLLEIQSCWICHLCHIAYVLSIAVHSNPQFKRNKQTKENRLKNSEPSTSLLWDRRNLWNDCYKFPNEAWSHDVKTWAQLGFDQSKSLQRLQPPHSWKSAISIEACAAQTVLLCADALELVFDKVCKFSDL